VVGSPWAQTQILVSEGFAALSTWREGGLPAGRRRV